ncbi:MAG: nuclear transport factor 2 family protein [Ruminiclostridium sp.]|nr:nuclear transport factor 2 family protein [Ruminiclostridium sp.]
MINSIAGLENKMWQAAKESNKADFARLVSADAVMVCGGYRCTGAEYAEFIGDFGISDFEITNFEVVHETDKTVQVHYIVRTITDTSENADLAGLFHVTSTWEKFDGKWVLVFNMDSRIMDGKNENTCFTEYQ